ncbi:MAG: D-aminoacyl-tRNA deacylase [bacterium]|nr:D-aminoacyl-tRNA deacylase [bacterium]
MRAVLQRAAYAAVSSEGTETGRIEKGLMVLLGVEKGDTEKDAEYIASKTADTRIFTDSEGKMNLSLSDIGGGALVVSQFTLAGDCRRGRRPSFSDAAPPEEAEKLYRTYISMLKSRGISTQEGVFRTHMQVTLCNDGPVTILLDSRKKF